MNDDDIGLLDTRITNDGKDITALDISVSKMISDVIGDEKMMNELVKRMNEG